MSVAIYIPVAKEFRLLPLQVELCRKHIANIQRIVVVETLPGESWTFSGGPWRLRRDVAASLRVEIRPGPESALKRFPWERISHTFQWMRDTLIPAQPESHALVLSGDVLPTKAIDVAAMCEETGAACRDAWIAHTWFATGKNRMDWKLFSYSVRPDTMEDLEPGFLHADKLVTRGDFATAKIPLIERIFGTTIPSHEETREELFFFPPPCAHFAPPPPHPNRLPVVDIKRICAGCYDRPEGCWKNREFGCQKTFRAAEAQAVHYGACPIGKWDKDGAKRKQVDPQPAAHRPLCPSCDLPAPSEPGSIEGMLAAVKEIIDRQQEPPAFAASMGIVTSGEGRYALGIKVMATILRKELKCDIPVKVFHRGPWHLDMRGLDVDLIDSQALQAMHPSKIYGGWQSKDYAVLHSGFERVLFLDADAYCVADPTPLFGLLDEHRYVLWGDYGPGRGCGPIPNELPHHQNGGEYLVNLKAFWNEMLAIRYLNNHGYCSLDAVSKPFRNHGLGDECSTRLVRSIIRDAGVFKADWVDRTRGVGILCRWQGTPYIAHRMRRESKLFMGTVPRGNKKWPLEALVMRLFEQNSPEYAAMKEAERVANLPSSRRAARQAILKRKGRQAILKRKGRL